MRNGNYSIKAYSPNSKAPYILGVEGSGKIEAIGENVKEFKVGDRVTHCMNLGTYSELMNVKANKKENLISKIFFIMFIVFLNLKKNIYKFTFYY